jgi:hypothetical protein
MFNRVSRALSSAPAIRTPALLKQKLNPLPAFRMVATVPIPNDFVSALLSCRRRGLGGLRVGAAGGEISTTTFQAKAARPYHPRRTAIVAARASELTLFDLVCRMPTFTSPWLRLTPKSRP